MPRISFFTNNILLILHLFEIHGKMLELNKDMSRLIKMFAINSIILCDSALLQHQ